MKKNTLSFAAGLLTGAVLFGGSVAYAAGVMAEYATQRAYVDGAPVQLEAYNIDGYNYVKLRDIGQAVGFNVYWDGQSIQVDSDAPYTGTQPNVPMTPAPSAVQPEGVTIAPDGTITSKVITKADWSREDFSQQANPAIFTGYYSRGWYNALRQSIVDRDTIMAGNNEDDCNLQYLYSHTLVPDDPAEQFDAFSDLLLRLSGLYDYRLGAEPYTKNQYEFLGYTIIKVCQPDVLKTPTAYIQPFLADLTGKSDTEKVIALNNYLCDLLDYGTGKYASIKNIFSDHSAPALGQCGSYAHAFKFLCGAADIPCIIVSGENHAWNEVYADGQWLTVDVTFNDGSARRDSYLLTKNAPRQDICPAGTRFAKELLVPGSTK